jgi:hypothetical protein
MVGAVGGVALLRLIGFGSTVLGVGIPWMLSLQFLAVAAAIVFGLVVIRRGVILEPPAALVNWFDAITARFGQRFASS